MMSFTGRDGNSWANAAVAIPVPMQMAATSRDTDILKVTSQ
jgi:hypothetical protein